LKRGRRIIMKLKDILSALTWGATLSLLIVWGIYLLDWLRIIIIE